ncbi:hypothetical protein FB479_106109 [Brevibacillus sp. AG162]|uniref:hypothetical protein n=1 Tax=Brevibacillus sp. AG162 TaxID=2572910 RepID=UPI001153A966|nr:hypothetical protein [Brevibacillus sp. AG162]TQK62026.1 hypothetical protein FB479_106109 [Brevibacillus sp. AG162]
MNVKRIISFLLLFILLFSNSFTSSSHANGLNSEEKDEYTLETIYLKDIEVYDDVLEFIKENNFEDEIADLSKQSNSNSFEKTLSKHGVDEETERKLVEKYGLEKPEREERQASNQKVMIQRNLTTNGIDGIIAIRLDVDDTWVELDLVHLQTGVRPIQRITGLVTQFNLSGSDWRIGQTKSVDRSSVRSGNFFSWKISKEAVSDYFEYDLRVTENNVTQRFDNKGDRDEAHQRYNFEVDTYKNLKPKGGQRHHLVSAKALDDAGFNSGNAPCIRMMAEDHYNTPNYGGNKSFRDKELNYLQNEQYEELLQFEVDALKDAEDSEGRYRNLQRKYYDAIIEALAQYHDYFGIEV